MERTAFDPLIDAIKFMSVLVALDAEDIDTIDQYLAEARTLAHPQEFSAEVKAEPGEDAF